MKRDGVLISVIIANYNSGEKLAGCVKSVLASSVDVEVIVVDNASGDESLHLLEAETAGEGRLKLIRHDSNLGFATACNRGAREASGGSMLYLNPDCVVEPDTLASLQTCLDEFPDAGMAGGLLLNPDGSEQIGGRRTVPTPWRTLVRVFNLSSLSNRYPRLFSDFNMHADPLPESPLEVEAVSGACMLVRPQAQAQVGGLDEAYFLHCEDLDWCMRFRAHGWKIYFVPDARVTHFLGVCGRSRPVFVEWHKHKGMIRFYRKFFRHQYPGILMWLVSLGVWLRFAATAVYHTVTGVAGRLGRNRDQA